MTSFQCPNCGNMTFTLLGERLSMKIDVECGNCGKVVGEMSRIDFIGPEE